MRIPCTIAAIAALLAPLAAQRGHDADSGPIVRTAVDANVPRAEDRVVPAAGPIEAPSSMPRFVTPIHTQQADPEGGAYGIWAAGADYKVSFHGRATFVPYLGSGYPHNQPFAWTTTSVTVGNEELVTRQQPLTNQVSGTRFEYDHGGVVEAYDVLLDGLEQTFVIANAPPGGDLVVRGTVASQLRGRAVTREHREVQFVDHNGDLILTYGAATAIDAAGDRAEMTTTFVDGSFELRLDGAWLATAAFPVVVDPFVTGNTTLSTWGQSYGEPGAVDVWRDDVRWTENVWISYIRHTSLTDQDLWVMRTDDNLPGTLFVQAFTDITTSWGIGSAQLAPVPMRVICAFERIFATTRNVRWHTHHINDLSSGTGYGSFLASNNNWRVDISGAISASATRAMVVFQHELGSSFANGNNSQIRAFYIDLTGITGTTSQGAAVQPVTILASNTIDCERPQTSRWGGPHRLITYQYLDSILPNDDWDVYVDVWDDTGALLAWRSVEPNNGRHKLGPVYAGGLLSYATLDASMSVGSNNAGTALETLLVAFDGTAITFPHPPRRYLTSSSPRLETRSIAWDTTSRTHWLVVSRADTAVWADQMGFNGASLQYDLLYNQSWPRGAAVAYDDDHESFVVVGSYASTASQPIVGNVWRNPTIPSTTSSGTSCSGSLGFWWEGSRRIGDAGQWIRVGGLPMGAPVTVGFSLATANVSLQIPGVGTGCNLLINNGGAFLGFLPMEVAGFGLCTPSPACASWTVPLTEHWFPATLQLQVFYLHPTISQVFTSNRLTVPIDY